MTLTPSISARFSRRLGPAVVAGLALAVMAAGCGGTSPSTGSSTGAAGGHSGPTKQDAQAAFQFSACMRNHGLTNFPDPVVKTSASQSSVIIHLPGGIAGTPVFKSAQAACQHILPKPGSSQNESPAQRHARTQAALAFARCMRAHGFPTFPDPSATGDLSLQMVTHAGISFRNPALLTAGENCASSTHGFLTRAQVAQAIDHAKAQGTQSGSGG